MIEAIEVNFDGALDDLKVEKQDPARYIHVQKKKESKDDEGNLLNYRVSVKDVEMAHKVLKNWKQPLMFDDLAFGKAVYGIVRVRSRDVVLSSSFPAVFSGFSFSANCINMELSI